MIHGWAEFCRMKLFRKNEFVSADARRVSVDPRTYEMLSGAGPRLNIKTPDRALTSPKSKEYGSTDTKQEPYVSARTYVTPISSFSGPRPPTHHQDWNPKASYAQPMTTKEFDLKISQLPD